MSNVELTAIFGRHETSEDAQIVVDQIEPNSIVFYEGILAHPFFARKTLYKILDLAAGRLQNGSYSDKQPEQIASKAFGKSTPYGTTLWDKVIAKNCAIITADYVELGLTRKIKAMYDTPVAIADFMKNPDIQEIENVTEAEMRFVTERSKEVELREFFAAERILDIQAALSHGAWRNMATNEHGTPKASIIYGTAHHRSLPRRLDEKGIPVHNIVLLEEPDPMCDSDSMDKQIHSGSYKANARAYYARIALNHLVKTIEEFDDNQPN